MDTLLDLLIGLALSTGVAYAAYRKGSLSTSGLYAAAVLGTLVFALGLLFWTIMILFFVSSSLLSKLKHQNKARVQEFAKAGPRDWLQVAANGAVGLVFAAAYWASGDHLYTVGYIAAFASVNSDTWATEIGVLSNRIPLSILTFKPVSPGVSGAVSGPGTGAALAGAVFISLLAGLGMKFAHPGSVHWLMITAICTGGGFAGCLTDSLLGATVQAMYRCRVCGKLTERLTHHGKPTELVRGYKFFQNDMVNLTSSVVGSLLAMAAFALFR